MRISAKNKLSLNREIKSFKFMKTLAWLIWSIIILVTYSSAKSKDISLTAILGALDTELKLIEEKMVDIQPEMVMGIKFLTGILHDRQIVLVKTGVGKVNAAMTITLLLNKFRPTEVILTGVAGGLNPDLRPGDIVIGKKLSQHDLGDYLSTGLKPKGVRNPVNGIRNPVFIPSDSWLIELAEQAATEVSLKSFLIEGIKRQPRVITGIIVTGDTFVSQDQKKKQLQKEFKAEAVEMEGAAIAQVCYQHRIPFIVLRSLSDKADSKASEDFKKFNKIAAQNSAELVIRLVKLLNKKRNN